MKRWLPSIVGVLSSFILNVATNIATSADGLKPLVIPAWVVAGLILIITIVMAIKEDKGQVSPLSPLEQTSYQNLKEKADEAVRTINREQGITTMRGGEHTYAQWETNLFKWQDTAEGLQKLAVTIPEGRNAWEVQIRDKDAARTFSDLVKALGPAMLRSSKDKDFLAIAPAAYGVAKALQYYEEAITLAYHIARAYYYESEIGQIRIWFKLLENTHPQNGQYFLQHAELRLMYLEIKGLLAKNDNHRSDACKYFTEALTVSNRLQTDNTMSNFKKLHVNRMIGILHMRIGELAEDDGELEKATEEYLQATTHFDDPKNSDVLLKCYDNLAKLAESQEQYTKAEDYYKKIDALQPAVGKIAISTAREGLARVYINKPLERQPGTSDEEHQKAIKDKYLTAYKYLREALKEENDNPNGEKANRMRETLVNEVLDHIIAD